MAEASRRHAIYRPLPPTLVISPPARQPIDDDTQHLLKRFAALSARARHHGDAQRAGWIDQVGLRAVAARLRLQGEAYP